MFNLAISHPTFGLQLIDLIDPRDTVSLHSDGTIVFYYPGGPPRPELLIFGAGNAGASFTAVGELTLQHKQLKPDLPEVNGKRAEKGPIRGGEVFHWHDFTVTVHATTKPEQAEWPMIDAARTSDSALLVYADWLESNGHTEWAEYARLSIQDTQAAKARMLELNKRVGIDFRARVARGPIERCWQQCGQRWENLPFLNEPWSRSCHTCSNSVRWCADSDTARAQRGGPVVLDPTALRKPNDLMPPPMPVG